MLVGLAPLQLQQLKIQTQYAQTNYVVMESLKALKLVMMEVITMLDAIQVV